MNSSVKFPPIKRRWTSGKILLVTALMLFSVALISWCIDYCQVVQVSSTSMEETLHDGDRLLVEKFNVAPKHQQLVVFHAPFDPQTILVKRVIGISGDRVHIDHGRVFVNGVGLVEPYANKQKKSTFELDSWPLIDGSRGPQEVVIPSGEYFVLGDNRDSSSDSRNWGLMPKEDLIGVVLFTWHR